MTKTICIIGSGPAALIAAWACHLQGLTSVLLSDTGQPSRLYGAQYLHSPFVLPGNVEPESTSIRYVKVGTREGYSSKVYGPDFDPSLTSWDKFPERVVFGWSLSHVYECLWESLGPSVNHHRVDRSEMDHLCDRFDLVVNTAPAHLFAEEGATHKVESIKVTTQPPQTEAPQTIIYNGDLRFDWYRSSNLGGSIHVEYPGNWPGEGVTVAKPLSIDKGPMRPNILPVGRYGKWKKGELLDGVFKEVSERIQQ